MAKLVSVLEQLVESGGGDSDTYRTLGEIHEYTTKNISKAVRYYTMAAALGDRTAHWNLGSLYYTGEKIQKDVGKGLFLLEKSSLLVDPCLTAEQNKYRDRDPENARQRISSLVELWNIFSSPDTSEVKQNYDKALFYLEEAAETDISPKIMRAKLKQRKKHDLMGARNLLFHMYKNGVLGVPKDEVTAKYWENRAKRCGQTLGSSLAAWQLIEDKLSENSGNASKTNTVGPSNKLSTMKIAQKIPSVGRRKYILLFMVFCIFLPLLLQIW